MYPLKNNLMNEVHLRKVKVMKTILGVLLAAAMFVGLCQPAQANHNVNVSIGQPTYNVSAFAFTPSFAVRSYAYASYPQLALQALPPVTQYSVAYPQVQLQAVDPCQPMQQVTSVQNVSAPAPTYTVETPLLNRLTVANYGVGVNYGNSLAFAGHHQRLGLGLHNANVNLRLAAGNVLAPAIVVPPVVNVQVNQRRGLLGRIVDNVLGLNNNVNVQVQAPVIPVAGANINLNLNQRRGLAGRLGVHRFH